MNILYLSVLGLTTLIHSKVIINLRIYNYENVNDITYNGQKCETFHFTNDYCDPMFSVCVTSKYKCDVVNYWSIHWKNKKYVKKVYSRSIRMENMTRSLTVVVRVDDHDRFDAHDHIAVFTSNFNITRLNYVYGNRMTVTPTGLNVMLYTNISIQCEPNYYGIECYIFCKPKISNYKCNQITGSKICLLDCGLHGSCTFDVQSKEFYCKCRNGWESEFCRLINHNNCSKLNCNTTCANSALYKNCNCTYSDYTETCNDILMISTQSTNEREETNPVTSSEIISTSNISYFPNVHGLGTDMVYTEGTRRHLASIEKSFHSSTMIMIICLLLLLCVSLIVLTVVIRSLKKRKDSFDKNGNFSLAYAQRPLPPVTYQPRSIKSSVTPPVPLNLYVTDSSTVEYDLCTVQSSRHYMSPLMIFESIDNDFDLYEQPIRNNMDSLTCKTDIRSNEDNESLQYELPTNYF